MREVSEAQKTLRQPERGTRGWGEPVGEPEAWAFLLNVVHLPPLGLRFLSGKCGIWIKVYF